MAILADWCQKTESALSPGGDVEKVRPWQRCRVHRSSRTDIRIGIPKHCFGDMQDWMEQDCMWLLTHRVESGSCF